MMLPSNPNIPWKPDELTIKAKSGYVINPDQVEFFKQLIKSLQAMYASISNAHNAGAYRSSGTATVANGDTSIVVSHGLSKTPALSDIQISPVNIATNAVRWAVTAVDATGFTITTSADPGASGALFAWQVHIAG